MAGFLGTRHGIVYTRVHAGFARRIFIQTFPFSGKPLARCRGRCERGRAIEDQLRVRPSIEIAALVHAKGWGTGAFQAQHIAKTMITQTRSQSAHEGEEWIWSGAVEAFCNEIRSLERVQQPEGGQRMRRLFWGCWLPPFISMMWASWVRRPSRAPVSRSEPKTPVYSLNGQLPATGISNSFTGRVNQAIDREVRNSASNSRFKDVRMMAFVPVATQPGLRRRLGRNGCEKTCERTQRGILVLYREVERRFRSRAVPEFTWPLRCSGRWLAAASHSTGTASVYSNSGTAVEPGLGDDGDKDVTSRCW